AGNRISARHDALGRRVRLSDPDSGVITFGHDGLGQLVQQTDARGITIAFGYDTIGRLRRRMIDGEPDAEWIYDQSRPGALDAVRGADGFARQYHYDDLLRPVRVITHIPRGL